MKSEDYDFLRRVIGRVNLDKLELQIFEAIGYSIEAIETKKGQGFIRNDRKREALLIGTIRDNYLQTLYLQFRAIMAQEQVDEEGLARLVEFDEATPEELRSHYHQEMSALLKQEAKSKTTQPN